ncbi:hypothetical protein BOSE62_110207 [Bosea sp. 62]|nr:hypothetical protein BOSE21B_50393 [Bosea sp. 21B]CAD5289436.1 hypothetical protein BOSE46_70373 [Bosea sp. 46]CAD5301158.1 hypothetical protein BOSE7B_90298 [Bosea sp. 7B]VXB02998.1 hypothetical protein BOSE62_110207 [Bosea sp. 62]VXB64381.1 hypothetical protein BOSE127_140239 [Bosea sp. 127]VXC61450.1 hypothetical protein BOSE29B_50373 [Bosea sp. 29B]VXC93226.1 hypothetical protein BOSE125_70437 [Bosea sp. 125]
MPPVGRPSGMGARIIREVRRAGISATALIVRSGIYADTLYGTGEHWRRTQQPALATFG